jgi:single-strand DNA-binding protein
MSTTIVGNLTRDPELTYTNGGAARARFGVAVSRRRKKGDEWTEETSFFDVVAWRDLAENVAESIGKGRASSSSVGSRSAASRAATAPSARSSSS